ncbi:ALI_HP2_G0016840.mRNA.1.CDS.1 [Saccharomyces cerevisiae]|nr:ALI_HP2_G0016840.mRNA.1.CDS.1 [Saccharomyces cerevisiae]CAI6487494.1 ALI_HP2_G0016840.mRNA.1.CDS.1 [Saccharomyces cerevisiae]
MLHQLKMSFLFNYPEGIEGPDIKYKKEHVKYTYGPTFLLQFKDKLNVKSGRRMGPKHCF